MEKTKYKSKRKLLLVYNDEYERAMVSLLLNRDEFKYIETYSVTEGIDISRNFCPDAIILSTRFSEDDCAKLVESVRSWSKCSIVLIYEASSGNAMSRLLEEGADDCISLRTNANYFNAKIRANLRRSVTDGRKMPYKSGGLLIDYDSRCVSVNGEDIHLSPVEYRIVETLSINAGKVVSYKLLLNTIWGPYMEDDSKILRVNMANIRRKLSISPEKPEYIHTIARVGYRMDDSENARSIRAVV